MCGVVGDRSRRRRGWWVGIGEPVDDWGRIVVVGAVVAGIVIVGTRFVGVVVVNVVVVGPDRLIIIQRLCRIEYKPGVAGQIPVGVAGQDVPGRAPLAVVRSQTTQRQGVLFSRVDV